MNEYKRDHGFASTAGKDIDKQKLDQEFDAISNAFKALYERIGRTINDDGTLMPKVVDGRAISKSVSLIPEEATPWREGVDYKIGDMVFVEHSLRWCAAPHKSVSFKTELDKWETVVDFAPYMEYLDKLAGNPRVARVSANIEAVAAVSDSMAKILEVHAVLDQLGKVAAVTPVIESLLGSGEEIITEIYKNLSVLTELHTSLESIWKLSGITSQINSLASRAADISAVAEMMDDVKTVAAFAKQLKNIAAGVGGAAG